MALTNDNDDLGSELRAAREAGQSALSERIRGGVQMKKYKLTGSLKAGWAEGVSGDVVGLDDEQAATINRLHPGLLSPVAPPAEQAPQNRRVSTEGTAGPQAKGK